VDKDGCGTDMRKSFETGGDRQLPRCAAWNGWQKHLWLQSIHSLTIKRLVALSNHNQNVFYAGVIAKSSHGSSQHRLSANAAILFWQPLRESGANAAAGGDDDGGICASYLVLDLHETDFGVTTRGPYSR